MFSVFLAPNSNTRKLSNMNTYHANPYHPPGLPPRPTGNAVMDAILLSEYHQACHLYSRTTPWVGHPAGLPYPVVYHPACSSPPRTLGETIILSSRSGSRPGPTVRQRPSRRPEPVDLAILMPGPHVPHHYVQSTSTPSRRFQDCPLCPVKTRHVEAQHLPYSLQGANASSSQYTRTHLQLLDLLVFIL